MPGKLLLVASDARLDELRALGDLPGSWLTTATADSLLDQISNHEPWVIACSPATLFPESGEHPVSQEDASLRAEVLQNLLDVTVCYLAVVDSKRTPIPAATEGGDSKNPGEQNPQEGDWTLGEHRHWYAKFRQELALRAASRHVHVNHALVLICCTQPSLEELDELKLLTGGRDANKLFDVCYVMFPELEPGKKAGQFFFATHVWPVAVGGLLMKLQNDEIPQNAGPADTLAWRCYHLLPDMPQAKWENFCSEEFQDLAKRITTGGKKDREWESEKFTKFQPLFSNVQKIELEQQDTGAALSVPWLDYPADARLGEVGRGDRWEKQLVKAGQSLAINLSQHTLDSEPAAWAEVSKIWAAVHRNPRFIHAALDDRSLIEGPDVCEQFQQAAQQWAEILEQDRQRRALIEEARQSVTHLTAAQNGFIGLGCRLIVVAAVALCLGYLSLLVFTGLVGQNGAMGIAMAGAIGSLLAGVGFLDLEGRAGKRGRAKFEGLLRDIDAKVEQRHYLCQEAVNRAHNFWQRTWARAAADRLKQLLFRVRAILNRELRFRKESDALFDATEDEITTVDETKSEVRAKRQRAKYRDVTLLRHLVDIESMSSSQDAELREFLNAQAAKFQSEIWQPFCDEFDRGTAGNFPARHLIPAIRAFATKFQADLLSRVRRRVMRQLETPDLVDWGSQILNIVTYQSYFELMSCRMSSHQTATHHNRPPPRLYLRSEFTGGHLMDNLAASNLVSKPVACEFLGDLPVIGFLFEEIPVQFDVESQTGITVNPYYPVTK